MKNRSRNSVIALAMLALLSTINDHLSTALAQGTAFSYQGQLQNNGSPASGTYNLTFSLFTNSTSGTAVAGPVTNNAVAITNGLFTVLINFGSDPFTGQTNWLQIGVASNGVSGFTTLSPRQQLTPAPYAIFANTASNLSGTIQAGQLSGTVPLAQLPGVVVTNDEPSVTLSNVTLSGTLTLPSPAAIDSGGSSLVRSDDNNNFYAGPGAGAPTNSGSANTAIGYQTLGDNTMGADNTALGYEALNFNTNGTENTASGERALYENTSGTGNSAYGRHTLEDNVNGSENTAVGDEALGNTVNDSQLVAIGYEALENDNATNSISTSGENTAVGYQALQADTVGSLNTSIGYQALASNTNGEGNTANGNIALFANTSGSFNTAIGFSALGANTSATANTAIGVGALNANTIGIYNTAVGFEALDGYGFDALGYNTSGSLNTTIGADALYNVFNGLSDIAVGYNAGAYLYAGTNDIYIGNPGGGASGEENGIIRIGTTGTNTFTYLAGNVVLDNTLNLDQYGQNNGNVYSNALIFGSSSVNPFSGEGIASKRTSGGTQYDLEFYTAYLNRMEILNNGFVGIGTTNPDSTLSVNGTADKPGGGSWNTFSDGRLKDVGADFTHGLEALDAIQPVHYHYKPGNPLNLPSQPDYVGVVAQQVQSAIPEAVQRNQDGYLEVNNDPIIWTMFNAIKELDQKRETEEKAKDAEIQNLKQQNDLLEKRLDHLEVMIKLQESPN